MKVVQKVHFHHMCTMQIYAYDYYYYSTDSLLPCASSCSHIGCDYLFHVEPLANIYLIDMTIHDSWLLYRPIDPYVHAHTHSQAPTIKVYAHSL